MKNKELDYFAEDLKSLTSEELEQKLKEYQKIEEQRQKEYNEFMNKYNKSNVYKEVQSIRTEIEARKPTIDVSNLEGTRALYEIELLSEKGKYPLSRENMAKWIKTLPGVKSVRVDDHDGDDIDECDWEWLFEDFFGNNRPA